MNECGCFYFPPCLPSSSQISTPHVPLCIFFLLLHFTHISFIFFLIYMPMYLYMYKIYIKHTQGTCKMCINIVCVCVYTRRHRVCRVYIGRIQSSHLSHPLYMPLFSTFLYLLSSHLSTSAYFSQLPLCISSPALFPCILHVSPPLCIILPEITALPSLSVHPHFLLMSLFQFLSLYRDTSLDIPHCTPPDPFFFRFVLCCPALFLAIVPPLSQDVFPFQILCLPKHLLPHLFLSQTLALDLKC